MTIKWPQWNIAPQFHGVNHQLRPETSGQITIYPDKEMDNPMLFLWNEWKIVHLFFDNEQIPNSDE